MFSGLLQEPPVQMVEHRRKRLFEGVEDSGCPHHRQKNWQEKWKPQRRRGREQIIEPNFCMTKVNFSFI
jgi:hypothetical protein